MFFPIQTHSHPQQYLLSTYYVPGTVLGHEHTVVRGTGVTPAFIDLQIPRKDKQQVGEQMHKIIVNYEVSEK